MHESLPTPLSLWRTWPLIDFRSLLANWRCHSWKNDRELWWLGAQGMRRTCRERKRATRALIANLRRPAAAARIQPSKAAGRSSNSPKRTARWASKKAWTLQLVLKVSSFSFVFFLQSNKRFQARFRLYETCPWKTVCSKKNKKKTLETNATQNWAQTSSELYFERVSWKSLKK